MSNEEDRPVQDFDAATNETKESSTTDIINFAVRIACTLFDSSSPCYFSFRYIKIKDLGLVSYTTIIKLSGCIGIVKAIVSKAEGSRREEATRDI